MKSAEQLLHERYEDAKYLSATAMQNGVVYIQFFRQGRRQFEFFWDEKKAC